MIFAHFVTVIISQAVCSGHFAIDGVAQGANQTINVSAAQLSHTTFLTGTAADQLSVQVFDGQAWSAWKSFSVALVHAITGTEGADVLTGDASANTIKGLGGDDELIGKAGPDVLDGGSGTDTASYLASSAGVTINLANGTAHGGDAEGDTLISIERVVGSAFDDNLTGSSRDETFEGGDGNDFLNGNGGADTLLGGAGSDIIYYHDGVKVDGGGGPDVDYLIADASTNATGFHFQMLGSNIEYINGNQGDDVVDATGVKYDNGDTFVGFGGNDAFMGGDGMDVFFGGDGNDIFVEAGESTNYTIAQYGGDGNSWTITDKTTNAIDKIYNV
jgi:Ca2+-binding RTX toxin-like protein